jgi:hypothetical protein
LDRYVRIAGGKSYRFTITIAVTIVNLNPLFY